MALLLLVAKKLKSIQLPKSVALLPMTGESSSLKQTTHAQTTGRAIARPNLHKWKPALIQDSSLHKCRNSMKLQKERHFIVSLKVISNISNPVLVQKITINQFLNSKSPKKPSFVHVFSLIDGSNSFIHWGKPKF